MFMVCFFSFFSEAFECLLPGRELRVYLAVRRPSVRSLQSEYSGNVDVTLLRVNFMLVCYHQSTTVYQHYISQYSSDIVAPLIGCQPGQLSSCPCLCVIIKVLQFTSTIFPNIPVILQLPSQVGNPVNCPAAPVSPAVDTVYKFVMEHHFMLCIYVKYVMCIKYIERPRNALCFYECNFIAQTQSALINLLIYFQHLINARNKEQVYMMYS